MWHLRLNEIVYIRPCVLMIITWVTVVNVCCKSLMCVSIGKSPKMMDLFSLRGKAVAIMDTSHGMD